MFTTMPRNFDMASESLSIFAVSANIDAVLFWDLFSFLSTDAVKVLCEVLRPHLHTASLGHAFSVHNTRTAQSGHVYGINRANELQLRPRPAALPGYSPHNQSQLQSLLLGWRVERSLLLPDSRLELLLHHVA